MALNAVYDIRVLFLFGRSQSDAATMGATLSAAVVDVGDDVDLMSVAILGATLWMTRARR